MCYNMVMYVDQGYNKRQTETNRPCVITKSDINYNIHVQPNFYSNTHVFFYIQKRREKKKLEKEQGMQAAANAAEDGRNDTPNGIR